MFTLITLGSISELHNFLNINDFGLYFTMSYNHDELSFLDLLFRDSKNKVNSKLFRKSKSFLHADSSHPQHTINGIPMGQYVRARRNCSNLDDFQTEATILRKTFFSPESISKG